MYTLNNTLYASEGYVLERNGIVYGKSTPLRVTFWSADGKKLASPVIEDASYYTEIFDKESKIQSLKDELAATDYKVIKYLEGLLSESDFEANKAYRQALRDEINSLEA